MKNLFQIWSRVITFDCTWVLFAHGTCVVVPATSSDPRQAARDILRGCAGGASIGSVIRLTQLPGWVVTAPHPDVLTYVSPDDVGAAASDVTIAYYGSAALAADASELRILRAERANPRDFARAQGKPGEPSGRRA